MARTREYESYLVILNDSIYIYESLKVNGFGIIFLVKSNEKLEVSRFESNKKLEVSRFESNKKHRLC